MRRIVLSDIDLTIRQQALSLAIMVVGIRVNKAVRRGEGGASHSALVFVVGQYTPDLIRSGESGCRFIVDCCQSRARRLTRSISPRRVHPPAAGHIVRGGATARGNTHAGRARLVASPCAQRPADLRHMRLSIYIPNSVTRRSCPDRQIRLQQYVDFSIAGTWSGTRHCVVCTVINFTRFGRKNLSSAV
jgi:hypothetical protein